VRVWKRYFPPVRLVWIFLAVIVWNADGFVNRAVAWPLLVLPLSAAVADLGLQAARFPRLRIPDAAIANGLFLSVILWPATVSIELVAVAVATVGVRHLVRVAGHPILNPAAVGVALAATVFALPQPWHVGLTLRDTELVAALGLILWSRAWHTWRLWGVFFATNIALTLLLADYLAGSSVLPLVVQTSVLGAAPVFYGFFMVTEPRTAPSNRRAMLAFGALVGVSAAVFPVLFAEYPTLTALGVLTPYLALFIGNVFSVALPSARGVRRPSPSPRPAAGKPASGMTSPEPNA
jgi:enediyne biosynthesis protein E5